MGCGTSKSAADGARAEPRRPDTEANPAGTQEGQPDSPKDTAISYVTVEHCATSSPTAGPTSEPAKLVTEPSRPKEPSASPLVDSVTETSCPQPSAIAHNADEAPTSHERPANEQASAAEPQPIPKGLPQAEVQPAAEEQPEGQAANILPAEEPQEEAVPVEEEPPYAPFAKFIAAGRAGDARYRQFRVKARFEEPVKPPKEGLPAEEEAELKRVWQEEWHGFPGWAYVLLARAAVGRGRWRAMSWDRKRAAVERFLLCGPWAATQEPDESQLAGMRATSSSPRFLLLGHPARRDTATGAFCAAHGLARTVMLKSDRPNNPGYYDVHATTSLGEEVTTAEVCHKIIVPATRAFGASYVDLFLGPELWDEAHPQSRDTTQQGYFLSHAWGMPFMQLVTVAIYEGAPPRHDNGPYWIDIFCKNQHVPIRESDLTDNILRSKAVLLAVHPWPRPLLTTRVWCLFEVLTAVQTEVDLRLKFCESAADGLTKNITKKYDQWTMSKVYSDIMEDGLSSVIPGAGEMVEAIDVRQAEATVASDRDMIMRLIESGVGAEEMNRLVREMMVKGLASAAQSLVQADIGQARLDYYSYEPGCD